MATNILDAFLITFGLDSTGFDKGAKDLDKKGQDTADKAKKSFGEIEEAGTKTATAFRGATTQLLGMFLAFQGASSITGLISGMISTTANADRMGQTLGMTTGRIVAWRQAMKEVGGQPGDADSALRNMENLKQGWLQNGLSGDQQGALSRLGIDSKSLTKMDPGKLLEKIAQAPRPYGDENYANRLQSLGLSDNMVYFLMQGGDAVKKQIAAYEKNAKQYEEQAKEGEKLQKAMADLNASVANALVPALNKIVPLLTDLVTTLDKWLGQPLPNFDGRHPGSVGSNDGTLAAPTPAGSNNDPIIAFLVGKGMTPERALGVRAGIEAESRGDPNANHADDPNNPYLHGHHAYGIGQWRGKRLDALYQKYGKNPNLNQQLEFLWSELNGGDKGGKDVRFSRNTALDALHAYIISFMRPGFVGSVKDNLRGALYLAEHRNSAANVFRITVNAQGNPNARDIAHKTGQAVSNATKRGHVAQADRKVNP